MHELDLSFRKSVVLLTFKSIHFSFQMTLGPNFNFYFFFFNV